MALEVRVIITLSCVVGHRVDISTSIKFNPSSVIAFGVNNLNFLIQRVLKCRMNITFPIS